MFRDESEENREQIFRTDFGFRGKTTRWSSFFKSALILMILIEWFCKVMQTKNINSFYNQSFEETLKKIIRLFSDTKQNWHGFDTNTIIMNRWPKFERALENRCDGLGKLPIILLCLKFVCFSFKVFKYFQWRLKKLTKKFSR